MRPILVEPFDFFFFFKIPDNQKGTGGPLFPTPVLKTRGFTPLPKILLREMGGGGLSSIKIGSPFFFPPGEKNRQVFSFLPKTPFYPTPPSKDIIDDLKIPGVVGVGRHFIGLTKNRPLDPKPTFLTFFTPENPPKPRGFFFCIYTNLFGWFSLLQFFGFPDHFRKKGFFGAPGGRDYQVETPEPPPSFFWKGAKPPAATPGFSPPFRTFNSPKRGL